MKKLLPFLFLLSNVGLLAQSSQQSLLITRIYGIQAGWAGECAAGVISNVSAVSRHNNYHSIYATGSGAWTVAMNFSDVSCAGPWTTFGAQSAITQVSNPPIAYANGYHPYIQIVVTGAATVTYSACKDFYLASSLASAVYPITLAQGGTGSSSFTAHGVLVGEGSSALSTTAAGTTNYGLVSNGTSADPTFQAIVNSFNSRTGSVVPTSGDYTAAMVTNAVDTTQTYNAPSWLTGISATNCPTCVTTNTTQTITGAKTFNGGVYVGSNQVIDGNAFSAWGGASLNDSTALGYVVSNIDHTWVNQDNESRGVSSVVRVSRSTNDEQTYGWDQFGIAGVVQLQAMTLPSDPIYGSPYIRGQQKAVDSELYYSASPNAYTANLGMNYLASLATVGAGVTLNTWAGLIVGQPGGYGGGGGHVVNGYGVWIQNLLDANTILTSATTAAIKIDGLGNYGRIWWQGASATTPISGTLEFSANTVVQTATGVGFNVGGGSANAGANAGSYAIKGVTIIDGSKNISTTGYINTSGAYETSGTTIVDPSRNATFAKLTTTGNAIVGGTLTIPNASATVQCAQISAVGIVGSSGTGPCGSGGGGGGGFNAITTGTNTGAAMTVGSGASLTFSGTGTINATTWYGIAISPPTTAGQTIVSLSPTSAQWVTAGGGGGGAGYGISYPFNPNTTSTLACGSAANAWFEASVPLTGAVSISVTCPPPSGGYIDVAFTFSTGSTSYAVTLPAPFNIGEWAAIPASSSMTCEGPYDGSSWPATCSSTSGASYFADAVFSGTITTNITGLVQCAEFNLYGVLVGTGVPCGSGGGGGTPGTPLGSLQINNGGIFGGITAGGDLTFNTPLFTLNTVNYDVGTCGDSSHFAVPTFNGKGLATGCTSYSSGSGSGNPFSGSVTANTALTDGAGFFINSVGVVVWSHDLSAVNIGNVFNINSNSGNIVTCQMSGGSCVGAGTGHVGSGAGTYGGYYIYNTQIIDGSANAYLGTVNGSSGTFTGSVTVNTTPTNYAGYYIQMPATNYGGGYTGNTGVIQYSDPGGSYPKVINIGHVQDITAGGTIFTTGHLAATPSTNIVPLTLIGSTGGTADLIDVYTQGSAMKALSVNYLGQTNIAGNINQIATAVLNAFHGVSVFYRSGSFTPLSNEVPLEVAGYTGGTTDLFQVFNYPSGTKEVYIDFGGNLDVVSGINAIGGMIANSNVFITPTTLDLVPLTLNGYIGGSADLLDVYNQTSGTLLFQIAHNGTLEVSTGGFTHELEVKPANVNLWNAPLGINTTADASTYMSFNVGLGSANWYAVSGSSGNYRTVGFTVTAGEQPYFYITDSSGAHTGYTGTTCSNFRGGLCVAP